MRCNTCGKETAELFFNAWGVVGDPVEVCPACVAPRPAAPEPPKPAAPLRAVDRLRGILEWAADAIDPPERRAAREAEAAANAARKGTP